MTYTLFTSESVAIGHPDKVADQISDAILDACIAQDKTSKVACEVLVIPGLVMLVGEITTNARVDYQAIARKTIQEIGYDDPTLGFDYRSCGILVSIHEQSRDIAMGLTEGAGDQGIMFGYACNETPELMPLPIMLAHRLVNELRHLRESKTLSYLRPDAKTQVTIAYDEKKNPVFAHTIVISTQHTEEVSQETLVKDMQAMAIRIFPKGLITKETKFHINPTGRFVIGGPACDCGMTGRKIIVDSYGGMAHHGGGSFSGKDPTKVDRSGAYMARYIAKNIVAAGLATRCEVQIAYIIGVSSHAALNVNTFGTGSEEVLSKIIPQVFDLSPKGLIKTLDLQRPIYQKTAFGGHFGRSEFTWERVDLVTALQEAARLTASLV